MSREYGTQPRMRALAFVLATFFPNWSQVDKIHESSPRKGGLSTCLQNLVGGKYLGSQLSARIKCYVVTVIVTFFIIYVYSGWNVSYSYEFTRIDLKYISTYINRSIIVTGA